MTNQKKAEATPRLFIHDAIGRIINEKTGHVVTRRYRILKPTGILQFIVASFDTMKEAKNYIKDQIARAERKGD